MTSDRHVVLKLSGDSTPELTLGGHGGLEAMPSEAPTSAPMCSVEQMTADEAHNAAKQDGTFVVRAGLPFTLIDPFEEPGAAVAAATMPWGLTAVGAVATQRIGKGAVVAVLDTGCDIDHEAFKRLADEHRIVTRNFTKEGGPDDVTDTRVTARTAQVRSAAATLQGSASASRQASTS